MSRITALAARAEPIDPSEDETVINGAPYVAHDAIRSGAETAATPVGAPDARVAEEIKRRQISLALRYVTAVRAR